ncbi:MAG: GDP-mannose 4,6-dehydratase [Bacteroides sp.]|nr:GDP-mannose 4,6-dehydratase [Bacteroides sp.]MCM1548479.1 GDP-mannose 4,6-dehydratase [Clostridium sp.]
MKALIIGAAGFVGSYLIQHLKQNLHWEIMATKMPQETIAVEDVDIYDLDILDKNQVTQLLKELRPDAVLHLAAQSSVGISWKNPDLTIDVNIKGSIHVLDSIRTLDYTPRVLLIGSGEEYGHILPTDTPIQENTILRPGNIYAATKACQNMLGKIYADAYQMDIISVRAFNHIGPNQTPIFVVADFCKQVAEIEAGLIPPVIHVGNLSAARDFSDVRDVVRAYGLLLQKGKSGETYNVGSGHAVTIDEILKNILLQSKITIQVEVDQEKLRPVDVPIIEADITKLQACTGWNPEITLEQTITDVLAYWRNKV